MEDKDSLRRRLLRRRDGIPPEVRHTKDRLILSQLAGLDAFIASTVILSFASFRSEVDTFGIMRRAFDAGKRVVLPRVDRENAVLRLCLIAGLEELAPGYMGIAEPTVLSDDRAFDANAAGIIIVPGAGFDLQGNRIGYGGGYYDRLLSGLVINVPIVAPAYEEQIVDSIPSEPHDIRVDVVVTDRRVIRCKEAGG